MGFAQAVRSGLTNAFTFEGRASRSEFWYFVLFLVICAVPAALADQLLIGKPVFQVLVTLATIVPYVSVIVRRLHDTGHSGWFYWIALIPLIGVCILIYWLCRAGPTEPNQYGSPRMFSAPLDSSLAVQPTINPAPEGVVLTATFQGTSFHVDKTRPVLRMGRGRDNDLVVSDTFASTTHARIECRGDRFYLVDQSSNGTYVGAPGMRDELVAKRETLLFGSGLIGLGRSPATEPDRCVRFGIQMQR
jgi:uncharacterized membrane protein YhaH (DUF805 family)